MRPVVDCELGIHNHATALLLAGVFFMAGSALAEIKVKARDVDPDLEAIQDHVATFDLPNGYYRTTYRFAEPEYWAFFPKWMRADARERKVTRILDIGCGYGTLLTLAVKIYGAKGYCIDSTPYISALAKKDNLVFAQGNIELDPLPWQEKFDVIIMTEVLEHFNFNPVPTLKKIRESMTPDGQFYLSTPDAKTWGRVQKYFKRLEDMPDPKPGAKVVDDHIWVYEKAELLRVLKEAGFKVEKLDYSNPKGASHFDVLLRRD
ncbi:MAG: class I SAM-dependent methyltransferase [Acidobacteria bacterium]|nr:class I SAM-dependent methyltransferase [Acidobacteriota bacterium]